MMKSTWLRRPRKQPIRSPRRARPRKSCTLTVAPWQPYFIGQQGNLGDPSSWRPFDFSFHFFWGLEDVISFTAMWNQLETNKSVGAIFLNDGDGNAGAIQTWEPVLDAQGYSLTDTGRYQNLTDDFSAQINAFKAANCEIVTGVPITDFTTFWTLPSSKVSTRRRRALGKPSCSRKRWKHWAIKDTISVPRYGGHHRIHLRPL